VDDTARPIALVPMGDDLAALALADRLRAQGLSVEFGYSGNLKKRMARANKANARAAVILGGDEAARGAATVRDLDSGAQEEVGLDALEAYLKAKFGA